MGNLSSSPPPVTDVCNLPNDIFVCYLKGKGNVVASMTWLLRHLYVINPKEYNELVGSLKFFVTDVYNLLKQKLPLPPTECIVLQVNSDPEHIAEVLGALLDARPDEEVVNFVRNLIAVIGFSEYLYLPFRGNDFGRIMKLDKHLAKDMFNALVTRQGSEPFWNPSG